MCFSSCYGSSFILAISKKENFIFSPRPSPGKSAGCRCRNVRGKVKFDFFPCWFGDFASAQTFYPPPPHLHLVAPRSPREPRTAEGKTTSPFRKEKWTTRESCVRGVFRQFRVTCGNETNKFEPATRFFVRSESSSRLLRGSLRQCFESE